MAIYRIKLPIKESDLKKLRVGDRVLLNGIIFTARDMAHMKLTDLIKKGKNLPFDLKDATIYYCGPTPGKKGRIIGSAGPTTSSRMDTFTPLLISKGVRATIGKGKRNDEVKKALKKYRSVYFVAPPGAGALLSKFIISSEVIAFPELGPEAIRKLFVKDFPVIVANDIYGKDIFEEGVKKWKRLD